MNILAALIPQSLAALSTIALVFAVLVQVWTPHNSKWSLWLALIGGVGVGGAFGNAVSSVVGTLQGASASATGQLFGTAIGGIIFAGIAFWFWLAASPKKGKGIKASTKPKQMVALFVASTLGAVLSGIPVLYNTLNMVVTTASTSLVGILS